FLASKTMRLISCLDRRPLASMITIRFDLPVVLSEAETFKIPLASMSKVTSIRGTPREAGGIPVNLNLPWRLLSLVHVRSPS
ncbi:hypothetical protein EDD17DRAFT_1498785, partial [Pisolithus thermaeus]